MASRRHVSESTPYGQLNMLEGARTVDISALFMLRLLTKPVALPF